MTRSTRVYMVSGAVALAGAAMLVLGLALPPQKPPTHLATPTFEQSICFSMGAETATLDQRVPENRAITLKAKMACGAAL